jgi:hypothetical protein
MIGEEVFAAGLLALSLLGLGAGVAAQFRPRRRGRVLLAGGALAGYLLPAGALLLLLESGNVAGGVVLLFGLLATGAVGLLLLANLLVAALRPRGADGP